MIRQLSLVFTIVSILGFTACGGGDPHEELTREGISVMEEFGQTLAKVTDKASAEAHMAELEALVGQLKDFQKRAEELGEPGEEKAAELEAALDAPMQAASKKMSEEMMRLAGNPEVMSSLQAVFAKMQE